MNNKQDFTTRKGRVADADTVTKLWKKLLAQHTKYFPEDFGITKDAHKIFRSWWKTSVLSRTKCTYVAEKNGMMIGYLMGGVQKRPPVLTIDTQAVVWDLYVHDDHRGKGVGAALMEEFFQWAREKGVGMVTLQVTPPNRKAVDFYKRLGFDTILQIERKMI